MTRDPSDDLRLLYRIGAASAVAVLAMVPFQMVVYLVAPPPASAAEWFALFARDPVVGLIDMDVLMLVDSALVGVVFLAIFAALVRAQRAWMILAVAAEGLAIAAYFASNPAFEMLTLSQRYAAAATEADRTALLGAGEAMVASWTGSAFNVSYVLGALATLAASWAMLRSDTFGKPTAYTGLVFGALSLVPASAGTPG